MAMAESQKSGSFFNRNYMQFATAIFSRVGSTLWKERAEYAKLNATGVGVQLLYGANLSL